MSYIYCNWWCSIRTFLYTKVHSLEFTLWAVPFIGFDQYMACTLHCMCVLSCFSRVQLFAIPWTADLQALLPGGSLGKNTRMGCHAFLQGSFWPKDWTRVSWRLLHCRQILYCWATRDYGEDNGTHSSTLAWKIPQMEEPGGLQSMGLVRVGHDWMTSLSLLTFMHWQRQWQPTPVFLPGESQGWGSLVGCRLWGRTELDTTEVT